MYNNKITDIINNATITYDALFAVQTPPTCSNSIDLK